MTRRWLLVLLILTSTGLSLAQPPVPLYGEIVGTQLDGTPDPVVAEAAAAATGAHERSTRLEAEVAGIHERKVEARLRLKQRVRALYRIRRGAVLPLSGGFDALLARAGRLERLERVIVHDVARLTDYTRREQALAAELTRARAEAAAADLRRTEVEAEQAALAEQFAAGELAGGFGTLPGLAVVPMATPGLDVYQPGAAPATSGFALLRGRLGLPITTSIGMRDAVRDDGPGVEFLARPGTTVMVVAEGRIAFAGDYGSYGRMVIVDHGDTFYTIYSGLGRVTASVGDWMARGAAIGEVGSGANAALFFEVRRGTRSLDTRNWLGVMR